MTCNKIEGRLYEESDEYEDEKVPVVKLKNGPDDSLMLSGINTTPKPIVKTTTPRKQEKVN